MVAKRRAEIFTAGCSICDEAVKTVREIACESCEVMVYDLNKPCESGECLEKVKTYGIKRLPAVAVDGRLLECCVTGPIMVEYLRAAGIGSL